MKIKIRCTGAATIALDNLKPYQGELKKTSRRNLDKIKALIIKLGFIAPFFIWVKEGSINLILDGHTRLLALTELRQEGYDIPELPVDYIEAETEKEAREILLSITSQYGDFNKDELILWFEQSDNDIVDLLRIVDSKINIEKELEKKELYTKKIIAPTYKPSKKKPGLNELYDLSKVETLLKNIESSDLPKEIKSFLILAAHRHTVFNYEKIADYYAHSDKVMQELMEESALVIIDFNKAIENGFVRLTRELKEQYGKDYEED